MADPTKSGGRRRKEDNDNNDDDVSSTRRYKHNQARLIIALSVLIIGFIVAVTAGLLLHSYYKDDDKNGDVQLNERTGVLVDCYPELRREEEKMRKNEEDCVKRRCLWRPQREKGAPWCLFPKDHDYVFKTKFTPDPKNKRLTLHLKRGADIKTDGVPDIFDDVSVDVELQTDNRLRIKLYPTNTKRWEIPTEMLDIESTVNATATLPSSMFNVTFVEHPVGIVVARKDTGTVVFNCSQPGTLLAKQFLQLTTALPSGNLYGFGEHRHPGLRHNMTWKSWSMFTRDTGPDSNWNLYGQHPVYLNIEDDGKANMVLLKNSNAMEVLLQPDPYPAVTFTTIGGVLDFYIYVGDSPADVTSHYIKSIGLPAFPPYWSLGFHLCRWGYKNISDMRSVMERTIAAKIPYDGQWMDIDSYYKHYPFTFDPEDWKDFPKFVDEMQTDNNLHFVPIVDPGVGTNNTIIKEIQSLGLSGMSSYDMLDSGKKDGIFIMNADGTEMEQSEVWPGPTVFPDFTNIKSENWWKKQIINYVERIGIKVDALWIDMNEPASFIPPDRMNCSQSQWNYPKYCPNILGAGEKCVMYDKTICMDSQQKVGLHYDAHSLYGHSMAIRTYKALDTLDLAYYKDKRPWTMTRSSFVGTGQFATKWTGDNRATWDDLKHSIVSIIEFGFFGFAMNGADICGFWKEPSHELCIRWHQLGAFYPFARNHNGRGNAPHFFKDQDPASFGQEFVDMVRPALLTRYRLLPYIYTSMYSAHREGRLVMQPLFYQFPHDKKTLTIDRQFMLGDSLLVSPVLDQGATNVQAYFPEGRWFDYFTGEEIWSKGGKRVDLATPLDKFNLHIRGGHVIPWQEPGVNTVESREKARGVIVSLDETGKAQGQLFWDDGISKLTTDSYNIITFSMEKAGTLTITAQTNKFVTKLKIQTVEIYGLPRMPSSVKVNDKEVAKDTVKFISEGVIQISGIDHSITSTTPTTITWSLY